jgi:hypothetical protein
MDVSEFVEIFVTEISGLIHLKKHDFLCWDFKAEIEHFNQSNMDSDGNFLRQSSCTIRHPLAYWTFFQHDVRAGLYPKFFSRAKSSPVIKEAVDSFLGTNDDQLNKHLSETQKLLASMVDCEKQFGPDLCQRARTLLGTLREATTTKGKLFWSLEYFFLKNGFNKFLRTPAICSTLYALITGCLYIDKYQLYDETDCDDEEEKIPLNCSERPLRIMSNFASSNGGGDNSVTWAEMSGSICDPLFIRRQKKVGYANQSCAADC